jgi:hypothetical protein
MKYHINEAGVHHSVSWDLLYLINAFDNEVYGEEYFSRLLALHLIKNKEYDKKQGSL